jgi:hypothetical protein
MPSKKELPDGPRRDFVEELRRYYRFANRPALRRVSEAIDNYTDPEINKVTASPETVRRMITGKVLPVEVARVRSVFIIFCELGGVDPDGSRWTEYDRSDYETNWGYLRRLWDEALEQEPVSRTPTTQTPARNEDPWATTDSGYSDEPPF